MNRPTTCAVVLLIATVAPTSAIAQTTKFNLDGATAAIRSAIDSAKTKLIQECGTRAGLHGMYEIKEGSGIDVVEYNPATHGARDSDESEDDDSAGEHPGRRVVERVVAGRVRRSGAKRN